MGMQTHGIRLAEAVCPVPTTHVDLSTSADEATASVELNVGIFLRAEDGRLVNRDYQCNTAHF